MAVNLTGCERPHDNPNYHHIDTDFYPGDYCNVCGRHKLAGNPENVYEELSRYKRMYANERAGAERLSAQYESMERRTFELSGQLRALHRQRVMI